jgi:DNA-binding NarL/FixJ family response regulator
MGKLAVVIADDHPLMLQGIRRALEAAEGIEVVGEARSGPEVVPLVRQTSPDVVLLDLRMPQLDGFGCLDRLREQCPGVKVVMLSMFSEPEHIEHAFRRGAAGYIVKSVNPLDLPSAIRQVCEGTVYHAFGLPPADEETTGGPKAAGLTEREIAVLKAAARGLSNQAIAKELWVTEQTVKFHLTNIFRKLGVANRTEAARYAFQHGLVETLVSQA